MTIDAADIAPLLLTPGPVPLPPDVLAALTRPMEHHRTPEFQKCFDSVMAALPKVFGTQERAYIQVATGSGGMESLLVNTLSPDDHVGCVVSGKFGERWSTMARIYGANVSELKVAWGQSVQLQDFEAWLRANPDLKLVLSQVCETSTGALHPVREMAQAVRKFAPHALFLVDAITALGALPLPMDEWGLDGVVGGSQKAFMLPTGLTFVAVSARAWKRVEAAKCPRFYFDLRSERKANEKGETGFSAAVPLVRALDEVLKKIESTGGWRKIYARIGALSQATREGVRLMGLQTFATVPSPSLTTILAPDGIDGARWRESLEQDDRIVLMGGQDQMKGKLLRVGHMGYISDKDVLRSLRAIGTSANRIAGKEKISAQAMDSACDNAKAILSAAPLVSL